MSHQSSRDLEAIDTFKCPKCKVKPGFRCVYLTGDRVGRLTKRPHNERLNRLSDEQHRRWRLEYQRRRDLERGHGPERDAILRAYAEQERREYEALRSWLRRYSTVLTQAF